ncbi:hypothetical protein QFZ24_005859 [Streptomyces phaeochromogenes]|nr:hypothetical protein [Streptomyces phaeochromogenes]
MAGYRPTDWHVLDLEKDPTPGDPVRVKSLAKSLHDFADDVQDALRLVKGMAEEDAVLTMVGKTADVFRDEFSGVPKNLKKLKKSYDLAGDALAAYWPELERAQALADKALAQGRAAQADLSSAKSRLSSADSWVTRANKEADKYKEDKDAGKDVPKPDESKVRAATRDAQSAESAQTSAQSDVTSASNALDAAKKMAADARKMREDAAGEAKRKLDEASDAGIQNRKWYEEVGDWFVDNWDTIVAVCKVVVAVLGIIALIIGGPILGAIVLIAALVVLADTLNKYMKGQASLWEVAFAALDCIPGMKGLTTLGGLAKGLKGLRTMNGLKVGLKGMAEGVRGMSGVFKGAARMPGGQIPYRALSPKARQLTRALENGHIPIRPGEVNVSHLSELQSFHGVEHAIIQNPAGDLRLFRGTERTSSIPRDLRGQDYDFIAHTHPEDRIPGPPNRIEEARGIPNSMSRDLEYKASDHMEVVVSRDGNLRFFDGAGIRELPQGTYPEGGPVNPLGFIVPVRMG